MRWKELPSWVKGGVIAEGVYLMVLAFVLLFKDVPLLQLVAVFLHLFFILIPLGLLGLWEAGMGRIPVLDFVIIGALYLFVGSIVGWIVEKIRGRGKK